MRAKMFRYLFSLWCNKEHQMDEFVGDATTRKAIDDKSQLKSTRAVPHDTELIIWVVLPALPD